MKNTLKALITLISLFFFAGCATSTLQTQAKTTRTISLMPDQLKDKRVYLRVTGTEASKIELEEPLRKALVERGVVLSTPDEANFYLHVNTLFADNLKEATNLNTILFAGGAVGILASTNNSGKNSLLIGIGTALAMGVADRALADETYRAVITVALSEKNKDHTNSALEWKTPYETRVLVEAVRMGLDITEAKPIMETKASYQIAEIFK